MGMPVVLERPPADPANSVGPLSGRYQRQRVYIFPTAQGWLYVLMLIVMLLGAINYSNNMAFMLCFLLAGLALVCMLHTYLNLVGLVLTSTQPKPVFVGQQALFPIQFDNSLGLAKYAITLESIAMTRQPLRKRRRQHPPISISLATGKRLISNYPVPATRRGVLMLEQLKLSSTFPLGIFTAWAYYQPEYDCLIYPAPRGRAPLPSNTTALEPVESGTQSGTDDFAGFRKYRAGDPVNKIAWKAFAREQGLLIKQFCGHGARTLIFNWDAVAYISDIESRLSQLCCWVLLAEKSSIHYGLEIPGSKIAPDHGTQHKDRCLAALARYGKP